MFPALFRLYRDNMSAEKENGAVQSSDWRNVSQEESVLGHKGQYFMSGKNSATTPTLESLGSSGPRNGDDVKILETAGCVPEESSDAGRGERAAGGEETAASEVSRNRIWCNKCKRDGELLMCDKCPRSYHLSCLELTKEDVPEGDWFCPPCRRVIDRQAERMAKRQAEQRERERQRAEARAKKQAARDAERVAKAAEQAKREAERSRREEEALIEEAERRVRRDTDRSERLRFEREERDNLKKLQALEARMARVVKFPIDDAELVRHPLEAPLPLLPVPIPCEELGSCSNGTAGLPSSLVGPLLMVWDTSVLLQRTLVLSPYTLQDLRAALWYGWEGRKQQERGQTQRLVEEKGLELEGKQWKEDEDSGDIGEQGDNCAPAPPALLTELHCALLRPILRDIDDAAAEEAEAVHGRKQAQTAGTAEVQSISSSSGSSITITTGSLETAIAISSKEAGEVAEVMLVPLRSQLEASPGSLGVPELSSLNALTWPAVATALYKGMPHLFAGADPVVRTAVEALRHNEYSRLVPSQKLALLEALCSVAYDSSTVRDVLRRNMKLMVERAKEKSKEDWEARRRVAELAQRAREEVKKEREAKKETGVAKQEATDWEASVKKRGGEGGKDGERGEKGEDKNIDEFLTRNIQGGKGYGGKETGECEEGDGEVDVEIDESLSRQEKLRLRAEQERRRTEEREKARQRERARKWEDAVQRKRDAALSTLTASIASARDLTTSTTSAVYCNSSSGTGVDVLEGLKDAVEKGREAGLETGRGERVWQHEILMTASQLVGRVEEVVSERERRKRREGKWAKELAALAVRTAPLGVDRHMRRYWKFSGDNTALYVQQLVVGPPQHERENAGKTKVHEKSEGAVSSFSLANTTSSSSSASSDLTSPNPVVIRRTPPPPAWVSRWSVLLHREDVTELLQGLDTRGVRERALKHALEGVAPLLLKHMNKRRKEAAPDSASGSGCGSGAICTTAKLSPAEFNAYQDQDKCHSKAFDSNCDTANGGNHTSSSVSFSGSSEGSGHRLRPSRAAATVAVSLSLSEHALASAALKSARKGREGKECGEGRSAGKLFPYVNKLASKERREGALRLASASAEAGYMLKLGAGMEGPVGLEGLKLCFVQLESAVVATAETSLLGSHSSILGKAAAVAWANGSWRDRRGDWLKSLHRTHASKDLVGLLILLEESVYGTQAGPDLEDEEVTEGEEYCDSLINEAEIKAVGNEGEQKITGDRKEHTPDPDRGIKLWPTGLCRQLWIDAVNRSTTVAQVALCLQTFGTRVCAFWRVGKWQRGGGGMQGEYRGKDKMEGRVGGGGQKRAGSFLSQSRSTRSQRRRCAATDSGELEGTDSGELEGTGEEEEDGDDWGEKCEKCGLPGELVCCESCPMVYHLACARLRRVPRGAWYCAPCKAQRAENAMKTGDKDEDVWDSVCSKCKQGGNLLCCDGSGCSATLHLACAGLKKIPKGKFYCRTCQKKPLSQRSRTVSESEEEEEDEDETEDGWGSHCGVCGKDDGELMCCEGCPDTFHVKCVGLKDLPESDWYCEKCARESCPVCGKSNLTLKSHVLCGTDDGRGCGRCFHLSCVGLVGVPEDDWFCPSCVVGK